MQNSDKNKKGEEISVKEELFDVIKTTPLLKLMQFLIIHKDCYKE